MHNASRRVSVVRSRIASLTQCDNTGAKTTRRQRRQRRCIVKIHKHTLKLIHRRRARAHLHAKNMLHLNAFKCRRARISSSSGGGGSDWPFYIHTLYDLCPLLLVACYPARRCRNIFRAQSMHKVNRSINSPRLSASARAHTRVSAARKITRAQRSRERRIYANCPSSRCEDDDDGDDREKSG